MKKNSRLKSKTSEMGYVADSQLSIENDTTNHLQPAIDTNRHIHEMQVNRLELEMQNETLRQVIAEKEKIEAQLGKYSDLYDFAPVGYFNLDSGGIISAVNLTGATFLETERSMLINRSFYFFISEETRPVFQCFLEKVFVSGVKETCEVTLLREGNSPFFVQIEAVITESTKECRAVVIDINARKLEVESAERLATFVRYSEDAIIHFDEHGTVKAINPAAEISFVYTSREISGRHISVLVPDLELDKTLADINYSIRINREIIARKKNDVFFPVQISIKKTKEYGHWSYMAIIRDISERALAAAALAEQKQFAENLVQNCAVPTFVINAERQVLIWNRACEELTGIKAEQMLGNDKAWKGFYEKKHPVLADYVISNDLDQASTFYPGFGKSSFIPGGLHAEGWLRNMNGVDRYLAFNAAPIHNTKGDLLAVIETFEDVTERKRYEKQLEHQANHDGLTNLPNRNLLFDRINQAMLMAQRNHHQVAVFFIDLDNFKYINDSLGHDAGDDLLKIISERLRGCVRGGDTVARQGGDEFIVIISQQDVPEVATRIADSFLAAISLPLWINEHELIITCSIGISISPRDGEDAQTLIKNADIAMYRAKEQGRNSFRFYTGEMNTRMQVRMTMEKNLRRALERDELFLCYQPKVSLQTGQVTGMEALVRWQNAEQGLIPPSDFISLAEETGLIESIGKWVLHTACSQNRVWQEAGLPLLPVAVNISAFQFRQKNFVHDVEQVLRDTSLDPLYLELELTESLVIQNIDRVTTILNELKEMGTSLTMDDFGTGYSSLSYLKRFPFDNLKIDKSFIQGITYEQDSAAITKAIIAMAHSLRLKVIAEGVETKDQLNYLHMHKCSEVQGYYFSKPILADEFGNLLKKLKPAKYLPSTPIHLQL